MGQLVRDPGDSLDHARPATYTSQAGQYRLLPAIDVAGGWHIYPEPSSFPWLCPGNPGYLAVPQHDPVYGYVYSFAIYRVSPDRNAVVGYAANLADMCWPAERDLIDIQLGRGTQCPGRIPAKRAA